MYLSTNETVQAQDIELQLQPLMRQKHKLDPLAVSCATSRHVLIHHEKSPTSLLLRQCRAQLKACRNNVHH